MMLDRSKDSKPLYLQIKDVLKRQIINQEYPVGSTIPSEAELEALFQVSRMTIRQAVNELVNEGLLRKERGRGKGTTVLSNAFADKLSTIKSFTEKIQEQGYTLKNKHINLSLITPDTTVASALDLKSTDKALCLTRIRMVNNDIIMYTHTYLPESLNLPIEAELYGSLYHLFQQHQIKVTTAEEYIEAMITTEEIAAALEVPTTSAVLKRTRISRDDRGRAVEYTITYYRSDKYKYIVELTV